MIDENTPPTNTGFGGGGDWAGALINLGTSIYNAQAQKAAQKRQNQANALAATTAYDRDKEMWNLQNMYNSPESQMARLKAAGLNPNMIYGSGSGGAAGTAGSPPNARVPQIVSEFGPLNGIPEALASYQNFQMRQAQIDNVKSQTENVQTRTANEALRGPLLSILGEQKELDLSKSQYQMEFDNAVKYNAARASALGIDKLRRQLSLMDDTSLQNALNRRHSELKISGEGIANEQRQAQLLFQQYKNDWMRAGVTTGDSIAPRLLVRMLNEIGIGSFSEGFSRARNAARKFK